jgi:hypothetical protein
VFWDVTPCSLLEVANISEERTAFIFELEVTFHGIVGMLQPDFGVTSQKTLSFIVNAVGTTNVT